MSQLPTNNQGVLMRLCVLVAAAVLLLAGETWAAVPGITGPVFHLTASAGYTSQPDGQSIYTWGYGCDGSSAGYLPFPGTCTAMQLPGPTLIVTEGNSVSVTLSNNLPSAAGNTSIVFNGQAVTATGGVDGLITKEAAPGNPVTYTFTATKPGTYSYNSGTRPDLQVEMGLFGALIVLPANPPSGCAKGPYSLASAAYDVGFSCYDREYLFQFSEMSLKVHQEIEAQVLAGKSGPLTASIEPYHPNYFLVNGRSMPDDMDANYAPGYPHQPYNGNPHMHPGELVLMRVIGQGRWQHPFHHHGNHVRVLARDGNLLVSQTDPTKPAGPLLFTIPTVSGQTVDAIFTWTGQGLNWDVYGADVAHAHTCNGIAVTAASPQSAGFDPVTHEYCPDHGKPIPVTTPDQNIMANGLWYGGSPYLGVPGSLPPGGDGVNPYGSYAYMWHSHDEREITTNDVFPGGMMMMLLIDSWTTPINESQ